MTLVLSLVTKDFLVQVSDRRLTRGRSIVSDRATKMVALCNYMALSYTGIAEIGGQRTDLWITETLSTLRSPFPGAAALKLRSSASLAFHRLPHRWPHAFVGVGWIKRRSRGCFEPFVMRVSNYHDSRGFQLRAPRRLFSANIRIHDTPHRIYYTWTGQKPPSSALVEFHRHLKRIGARGLGQPAVLRLLVWLARRTADHNPTVGRDLLATCLPIGAMSDGYGLPSYVIKGGPSESDACFLDLPAVVNDAQWHHPHVVCGGFSITNLRLVRNT